jgi:transcriptional regulator with XRE-family HTH domain
MTCQTVCMARKIRSVSTELLHPVMMNAAENLDMLFTRARLSQRQVGKILGIGDGQVSRLLRPKETGQVWSLRQLAILAECFGVSLVALLGPPGELFDQLPPPSEWALPRVDSNHQPADYVALRCRVLQAA